MLDNGDVHRVLGGSLVAGELEGLGQWLFTTGHETVQTNILGSGIAGLLPLD